MLGSWLGWHGLGSTSWSWAAVLGCGSGVWWWNVVGLLVPYIVPDIIGRGTSFDIFM